VTEVLPMTRRLLVSAAVAALALTIAGPASAQDAPGHCPSITKAKMKTILAPYKRKYGARNIWGTRSYSVWSEHGALHIYYAPRYGQLRHLKTLPMKNLCPLEGDPQPGQPNWWPRSIPYPL
jgi:hypothetical protein